MPDPLHDFAVELYEEHLEEAGILYEQRIVLARDAHFPWQDLGDLENRFTTHFNALMMGGQAADQVFEAIDEEAEPGECYTLAARLCRRQEWPQILHLLDETDWQAPTGRAVMDALVHACPDDWVDNITAHARDHPHCRAPAASLTGHRRVQSAAAELISWGQEATLLPQIIWSLGRVGDRSGMPWLLALNPPEEHLALERAIALQRLGEQEFMQGEPWNPNRPGWWILAKSLAGRRDDGVVLLAQPDSIWEKPEAILALGLLGYRDGIDQLFEFLQDSDKAAIAALALELITGAGLNEEVFVPETLEEDELFEAERKTLEQGGSLVDQEGEPYGHWATRRCEDAGIWSAWWSEQQHNFARENRWRGGLPFSPFALVGQLAHPNLPNTIRDWIHQELVIHFGAKTHFEWTLPVVNQLKELEALKSWALAAGGQDSATITPAREKP